MDIYSIIRGAGFEVWTQGSAPQELPESFFTVWKDDSADILHADNKAQEIRRDFTLIYYTKDFATLEATFAKILKTLKANGYKYSGDGYDYSATWEGYAAVGIELIKTDYLED